MKKTLVTIILAISLILSGCGSSSSSPVMECTLPLIHSGNGCCMDADKNGVCDIDEAKPAEEAEEDISEVEELPEPVVEEASEPEEVEAEPAAPLKNTKEEAEKVAKLFKTSWEKKQFNSMYISFTPTLKKKKSAAEFTAIMELDPFYKKIKSIDLNSVVMTGEDTADMDIIVHTNVQHITMPATTLKFADGAWKVRAFVDVFEMDAYDAACSGYRDSSAYDLADCANDFARKVKNSSYCKISECHYVDCLKALGAIAGITQEAEQCKICQPTGKTTNSCILDVAIKFDKVSACDVISEDKYNDKYCVCYGGFAKHKGTSGYCNMIGDSTYKDLCMKGYEGGFC